MPNNTDTVLAAIMYAPGATIPDNQKKVAAILYGQGDTIPDHLLKIALYNRGGLLATGQTTQYSSEQDDGALERGLTKRYQIFTTGQHASTTNIDLTHLVSSTVSFTAATKTITSAGEMGVFKAAGGETIVISGAGQVGNNGVFTTVSATANTVVVTEALTDESAGATITIKKREAKSNNVVLDLNTGLMWARYVSDKMGTGGDGKMPWSGVAYDIFAYCAAVNAASVGGYSDWEVPNLEELFSLTDYEQPTAVPDTTAFPSWPADIVWSSTTRPSVTTEKMYGVFSTGKIDSNVVTTQLWTALVRR